MSKLIAAVSAGKSRFEKSELFFKYIKQTAWAKGIPLMGSFELTPRCTLDCGMCYVHLKENQMTQSELRTDQWIKIMDEAADAGMMFATLTGGECLMHPGFKDIYNHLQDRGILITVLTNGTILDEDMICFLSERSPQRVQVSVYGSSLDGYRAVTGHAEAFYRTDRAIDLLRDSGIPFNLAVTVSKQMINDFKDVLNYCKSKEPLSCSVNSCPFEARKETEREYDEYAPSLDEQVFIFKTEKELLLSEEKDQTSVHNNQCGDTMPEKGMICSAGRNAFAIDWKGKMIPCEVFDYSGQFPLKDGFADCWKRMNQNCVDYINPVECIGCSYFKACRYCPAGHYLQAGIGHAGKKVCEEGHRMVSEGIRYI